MCFSSSRKSTNSWNASGTSSSHLVSELEICIIRNKRFENRPIEEARGLKLEGEVDMTVSFNYLVMPDKLMKARALYGEGLPPLLILSKTPVLNVTKIKFLKWKLLRWCLITSATKRCRIFTIHHLHRGRDLTSRCWQDSALSMFYFRTNNGSCLFTITERFDWWWTLQLN